MGGLQAWILMKRHLINQVFKLRLALAKNAKLAFLGLPMSFHNFFFTDSLVLMFNNALYSKHNLQRTDHMKKVNHNAYDFRMAAIFPLA